MDMLLEGLCRPACGGRAYGRNGDAGFDIEAPSMRSLLPAAAERMDEGAHGGSRHGNLPPERNGTASAQLHDWVLAVPHSAPCSRREASMAYNCSSVSTSIS